MIKDLLDTFTSKCTYKSINKYNPIKLRDNKNGIAITDAIYYRFAYSNIHTTKNLVASDINMIEGIRNPHALLFRNNKYQ
jgi:hypothetical protein